MDKIQKKITKKERENLENELRLLQRIVNDDVIIGLVVNKKGNITITEVRAIKYNLLDDENDNEENEVDVEQQKRIWGDRANYFG